MITHTIRITAITALIFGAVIVLGSCGLSYEDGQQTYSFRSDPDSVFLRSESVTNFGLVMHESVVKTDGRFKYSVTDINTRKTESFKTRFSEFQMKEIFQLITDSGLLRHDHLRAKIADLRDTRSRLTRSDSPTTKLTIQLAESNCPGRRSMAPITARVSVGIWPPPTRSDVSEFQAARELAMILDQHRDKVTQPNTLYRH